jgi:hypothetical protein
MTNIPCFRCTETAAQIAVEVELACTIGGVPIRQLGLQGDESWQEQQSELRRCVTFAVVCKVHILEMQV